MEVTAAAEDHSASEPVVDAHGELVLVVDDEPAIREILESTLVNHGYRVIAATQRRGDALCSQNIDELDLVILDMMMPVMDGRPSISSNSSPACASSASTASCERQAQAGRVEGITFLTKPFTTSCWKPCRRCPSRPRPPPAARSSRSSSPDLRGPTPAAAAAVVPACNRPVTDDEVAAVR